MSLTDAERLNLKKLINESECENNTENIRRLKHSDLIRTDIRKMEQVKKDSTLDKDELLTRCQTECAFLFNNYTDIFNKVYNDELDFNIMAKLLVVLKMIEEEKVDQHEGSVIVGKILKELYLDSAIKRADNIDAQYAAEKVEPDAGKPISWSEFKRQHFCP